MQMRSGAFRVPWPEVVPLLNEQGNRGLEMKSVKSLEKTDSKWWSS